MYHRLLYGLFFLFLASPLLAQPSAITGRVVDLQTREPLSGATVTLQDLGSDYSQGEVTEENGVFLFRQVPEGSYKMQISYLGYTSYEDTLRVGAMDLNLETLMLGQGSVLLNQVRVVGQQVPALQMGDTTQFNAEAFKTNPDADAADLVRKMPGVSLQNGRIQAQGEEVQEVLVDGRRFFGNDPNAALRNLPADVVDKIQVYDQQSEESKFTGVDDGETIKTINIITKSDKRTGQFGQVAGGYGWEDKYRLSGNINFFNGDRRISVLGMSNNINIQNFSSEDLVGVAAGGGGGRGGGRGGWGGGNAGNFLVNQQDGIATTHALGLNYSDMWGEKVEVSGSYFLNYSDNDAARELEREFVNPQNLGQFYRESTTSETQNTNHRFNMRLDYEINENNSVLIRPRFSFQQNKGASFTEGATTLEGLPLNATTNEFRSDLQGINFSNDILFRHRFQKERRTLSIEFDQQYNSNLGESFLYSENILYDNNALSDTLDQFNDLQTTGWSLGGEVTFTEPVGEKSALQLEYEVNYRPNQSDKRTFDYDDESLAYDRLNNDLTNIFDNYYLTQEASAGYRLGDREFNVRAEMNLQWAELGGEQTYPYELDIRRHFFNLLPGLSMRYRIADNKNLRLFYRTDTDPPSISQLQEVIDNRDPLRLRTGNPELGQSYQHRLFTRYSATNTEKSSVFFAMLGGGLTHNYIANSTVYARQDSLIGGTIVLPKGGQLVSPVNLDGNFNLRSFMSIGRPVNFLKSNLNLNLSAGFNRLPGEIDGQVNYSNNTDLGGGITLSSNISEKVDFTLSTRSSYNIVRNSLNSRANNNYFNQQSELQLNLIIGPGIVFRSDMTHQFYAGLAEDFDTNYWLWNLSLGKKIFANQRGEISLLVFDLLNENTSIRRTVSDAYIEDVQTQVLQRYFMLSFSYKLRKFSGGQEMPAPQRPYGNFRRRY